MPRLLGNEAERRHPRLGVDLEQEQSVLAACVIPAEIGARTPLAAQQPVRLERDPLARRGDLIGNVGGEDMVGQSVGIFGVVIRSEEHTSELQSLMRISYAVFCLKKKTHHQQ